MATVADRRYNRIMSLMLHEFHHSLGARFAELNGAEIVNDYGDWLAEHAALRETAGVLDLSFRCRICLTGADRVRFLHGQVTNDVKKLRVGEGCYAAITTNKGKMESDLNIFCLADELLLDFEPGLTGKDFAAAGKIHRRRRRANRGRRAALRFVERARAEGGGGRPRAWIVRWKFPPTSSSAP